MSYGQERWQGQKWGVCVGDLIALLDLDLLEKKETDINLQVKS